MAVHVEPEYTAIFLQDKFESNTQKYNNMKKIMKQQDIEIFYGDNDDYFDSTKLPPYLKVETSIGKRKQHFKAEFSQKKMKVKEYPDNFSKVDTSLSETELKKKFPNFINDWIRWFLQSIFRL
jgi:hypothetical protein